MADLVQTNKVGRPLKFKSNEELQEKINQYFKDMTEEGRPLTLSGMAVYLECDRQTILNYSKKDEYFGTIKKAKQIVEAYAEEKLISTSGIAAGIIFSLKNNFGWEDRREVEVSEKPKPLMAELPEPKVVEVIEVVDSKPQKAEKPKEEKKSLASEVDVSQLQ